MPLQDIAPGGAAPMCYAKTVRAALGPGLRLLLAQKRRRKDGA